MIGKSGDLFSEKIMLKLKRDRDSTSSHRALVVVGRSAPARQIDCVLAFGEFQRLIHCACEIIFDELARHLAAQEIGPEELAERRGVLGKAAGPSQFAGQTAERIVLQG